MGILLYVLGLFQILLGILVLIIGWLMGSQFNEADSIYAAAAGMLFFGIVGGALTMVITGLVTITIGSIHNAVKRVERRLDAGTPARLDPISLA